ncbi:MAG: hypothetical protein GY850_18075 [bacterium]|nr:hypothetical protein [bacterium]
MNNKPYMEPHYDSMLTAVENPTWVLRGYAGSLIAVVPVRKHAYLHTVYKEINLNDGFIITSFISKKVNRRMIIWPKNK